MSNKLSISGTANIRGISFKSWGAIDYDKDIGVLRFEGQLTE